MGNDTLIGNEFANILDGANGNDILVGGAGNDTLRGGNGSDTISYIIDTAGIKVSLRQATGTDGWGNTDIYDSIENILGSSFDDTIEGNSGNNILNGGAGIDTITFENAIAGVNVNLAITTVQNTGNDGQDIITNFENLIGTNFADTLLGDTNTNIINGLSGNDVIDGNTGNDTLYGGEGNDRFIIKIGDGNDVINGYLDAQIDNDDEFNRDTLDYSQITTNGYFADVDLSITSAYVKLGTHLTNTTEQTDTISNIENIIGSSGDDILKGNAESNTISSGLGSDTISGGLGNDKLIGNAGNDVFVDTSFAGDAVDGAEDNDTIDYRNITSKITLIIEDNGATTDVKVGNTTADHTIENIENIYGSNIGNDEITGNNLANSILGFGGDDTIDGGTGADYLDGGVGTNTISFKSFNNSITVNLSTETSSDGDTIRDFTNIIGTNLSAQSDTLIGNDNLDQQFDEYIQRFSQLESDNQKKRNNARMCKRKN